MMLYWKWRNEIWHVLVKPKRTKMLTYRNIATVMSHYPKNE